MHTSSINIKSTKLIIEYTSAGDDMGHKAHCPTRTKSLNIIFLICCMFVVIIINILGWKTHKHSTFVNIKCTEANTGNLKFYIKGRSHEY